MNMNKIKRVATFWVYVSVTALAGSGSVFAEHLEKVWTANGMKVPESVVYNAKKNTFYVSNMNGKPMEKNGLGSIARITSNGKTVEADWVSGLNAPKGTALKGQTLYVVDIQEILAIDTASGRIVTRYYLPESKMLNDISVNPSGDVFVSDFMGKSIYKLVDGEFKVWFASNKLDFPKGIWATNDYLYIGTWGKNPNAEFKTETPGSLKRISLSKPTFIENVGNGLPLANIDGVEAYKGGWLLTDHMAGKLVHLSKNGDVVGKLPLRMGASDHAYVASQNLVVVPMMMNNTVEAYRIIE